MFFLPGGDGLSLSPLPFDASLPTHVLTANNLKKHNKGMKIEPKEAIKIREKNRKNAKKFTRRADREARKAEKYAKIAFEKFQKAKTPPTSCCCGIGSKSPARYEREGKKADERIAKHRQQEASYRFWARAYSGTQGGNQAANTQSP